MCFLRQIALADVRLQKEVCAMKIYTLKNCFAASTSSDADVALSTLRGLCEGILPDGVVNTAETEAFRSWVQHAAKMHPVWPLTDIMARLERMFADGVCDEEERAELKAVMESLCGRGEERDAGEAATALPLDVPPPRVVFPGREFVMTGNFAYGSRAKVMDAIIAAGGMPRDAAPRHATNYLIVGAMANGEWKHAAYGRKIQTAMELKSRGAQIAVISEAHWRDALQAVGETPRTIAVEEVLTMLERYAQPDSREKRDFILMKPPESPAAGSLCWHLHFTRH